jgi:chromate transporter
VDLGGGLSFGGGFVIIPLMQADAVTRYYWMTGARFPNEVALGQVTPGPVVQTVAVVGYAAAGPAAIGAILGSAVVLTLLSAAAIDVIIALAVGATFTWSSAPSVYCGPLCT